MQFSKYSFAVECRCGNQWQQVARYSSQGIAQLKAKTIALQTPFHAVRVRKCSISCNA